MSKLLSLFVGVLFVTPAFSAKALTGTVRIDGSSTVYPISAAVAEEFGAQKNSRKVRVTVAYSGTGGGFKKWCKGETDINDASRQIKQKEIDCAKKNSITHVEIPVAYDGLSVVVSKKNTFIKSLSMDQLKKLWEPGSKIKKWSQLDPSWPDKEIKLFGPGADSGTFDYFTEAVMHKSRASRADYIASEDDNVLVKGVSASPFALGYFGYAYYQENKDKLKIVPISKGKGAVTPSNATIMDSSYPLAREIFIYVSSAAAKRAEVNAFVEFYLTKATEIVKQVGYTPLTKKGYKDALDKYNTFRSSLKLAMK